MKKVIKCLGILLLATLFPLNATVGGDVGSGAMEPRKEKKEEKKGTEEKKEEKKGAEEKKEEKKGAEEKKEEKKSAEELFGKIKGVARVATLKEITKKAKEIISKSKLTKKNQAELRSYLEKNTLNGSELMKLAAMASDDDTKCVYKEIAEALMNRGARANDKDKDDMTPLHHAARSGNTGVAEVLLKNGANIDAQDNGGDTPLHYAAGSGNTGVAEMLLKNGANIDAQNRQRKTPLHYTADYGYDVAKGRLEIAKTLMAKGANAGLKDSWDNTPLHCVIENEIKYAPEMVELIAAGKDSGKYLNQSNCFGNTPLHLAVRLGTPEIVANLIGKGASVESKNGDGDTPLHLCWRNKEHGVKIAEKLIAAVPPEKRKQYPNTENNIGNTPLHQALKFGKPELVRKLMSEGAYCTTFRSIWL